MNYIDWTCKTFVVDTPSVDRLFDDGVLSAHNIFWDTKDKNYNITPNIKPLQK